jgi:hypothetical protein
MEAVLVGIVIVLIGGTQAMLFRRVEKKADKDEVDKMQDCLTGKGGMKEVLTRVDERVNFLYEERKNGKTRDVSDG